MNCWPRKAKLCKAGGLWMIDYPSVRRGPNDSFCPSGEIRIFWSFQEALNWLNGKPRSPHFTKELSRSLGLT